MKKIFFYAMMLVACTTAFTSCSDDNDSNPTLIQPTEFVLNELTLDGNALINLEQSKTIPMSWSQPVYTNFNSPVIATYSIQISKNGNFAQEYDANLEDNSASDFVTLDETFTTCNVDLSTENIDKAIVRLYGWTEDSIIPNELPVYIRVKAAVQDASFNEYGTVYSNVVKMRAIPYYIELANAPIELWYLTGNCIANGSWTNSADAIGTGMTPMYPIPGMEYDKVTGQGVIEYAGFFPAGAEFKIIAKAGLSNWNYGMCGGNEEGGQVYRDGGDDPGNITITEEGYYRIQIDTKEHKMTWEKLEKAPAYTQIAMPGAYQGWDTSLNLMDVVTTVAENHDWFVGKMEFSEDTELKFAADNAWDVNWGKDEFPYGKGEQNGANIPVAAGKYNVYFNDILGTYNFIPVE